MKKIGLYSFLWIASLLLVSCDFFTPSESSENIARVNSTYLTRKDLASAMPKNLSVEDSSIYAQNFINRWAKRQLLLEGAKLNLSQEKQKNYNAMVEEYRQELFSQGYKDLIIASKMDTSVTPEEIESYYEQEHENFRLKENLIKLRYVQMTKDNKDIEKIKEQFKRYNDEDQEDIQDESFKFEAYSLMDSIWVSTDQIRTKISPLQEQDDPNDLLKKDNYLELNDSTSLYLIYIKDVRLRNDQAPLDYAKPTIKEIILNKRKLQFAKEFEKDITKDALENNQFEIYK